MRESCPARFDPFQFGSAPPIDAAAKKRPADWARDAAKKEDTMRQDFYAKLAQPRPGLLWSQRWSQEDATLTTMKVIET